MADFENSHSSKDLRRRDKRISKVENIIQIADIGESIGRLEHSNLIIGKTSSRMEDETRFLASRAFKGHCHRSPNNEQPSSHAHRLLIKEEENKEKKPKSLTGTINREMKVTSQPYQKENLEKKISIQPMSHSKTLHSIVVDMALFEIESCQELKSHSKKQSRHEDNLLILKKFLKVRKVKEDNSQGVFFATSFPLSNDINSVEERVKQMATTLAMVTLRQWMLNGWKDLERLAKCAKKSHIYSALQDNVFKSLAKFILSIFDTEDLERHNFYDRTESENKKFYREKLLSLHLEDGRNAVKLIAEGKITFDGFPLLTEYDIGFLMQGYISDVALYKSDVEPHIDQLISWVLVEYMNFVIDEIDGCCFKKGRHKRYVEMARTVMLQFAPLKEEIKMHAIMENGLSPCYCITDALRYEALCDIGILDIKKHLTSADLEDILEEVAWRTNCSMLSLSGGRYDSIRLLYVGVIYVLMFGPFGSFTDEVINLVKIAEARRRYEGHCYISRHHILWAVGLTGVKGFVEKLINGLGLQNLVEESAAYPPYNIYMSARTIANILGDEIVGVEHLVVAITFEVNQRRLNGKADVSPSLVAVGSEWKEFESKKCVQAFLSAVKRYKKKPDRNLIKMPTKIVECRAPETKLMDQLRRLEKDMKYGWHEFAGLRCESV